MNKCLSVLLVLCLLLGASSALAQTVTTELMRLDNGVTIVINHDESVQIKPAMEEFPESNIWMVTDQVHANVFLNIAVSEIDSELSLADLTEEEQMQYGRMIGAMYENPEIHLDTTPSGNLYLHVCSNEESDIDSIFTIYKGCFVELIQFANDFAPLTEDDKAFCLSVLHGIEFVAE